MNSGLNSGNKKDEPESGGSHTAASPDTNTVTHSRSWSELWRLLKYTPLSDIFRGHLTGSMDAEQWIDGAGFSEPVTDVIRKTWREYQSHHRLRMLFIGRRVHKVGLLLEQLTFRRDTGHSDPKLTEFLQQWLLEGTLGCTHPRAIVQSSSLPQPLQRVVIDLLGNARLGRFQSRRLAISFVRQLETQLDSGAPTDEIIAHWSDVVAHPALTRLNDPGLVLTSGLPVEITAVVDSCVRRTRLWRREQIDVARELITHFQDGLQSGLPTSRLVADFGDLKTAALLIRRARLRCRPLVWRMARRSMHAVALILTVAVVCWSWLIYRFMTAKPGNVTDYIGEVDARSRSIPDADRAWPLYRRAFAEFTEYQDIQAPPEALDAQGLPKSEWDDWIVGSKQSSATSDDHSDYKLNYQNYFLAHDDIQKNGAESKAWPAMLHFRNQNSEALELLLEGSTKPALGFIYRDDLHKEWMKPEELESFLRSTKTSSGGVLLPHIQKLALLRLLLVVEFHRALECSDRTRMVQLLNAELQIADQFGQPEFAIAGIYAHSFRIECWKSIRRILQQNPELLTEQDLRDLAHRTAGDAISGRLEWQSDARRILEDWIGRLYSEDENGDGQLTASGYKLLLDTQLKKGRRQPLAGSPGWQLAKGAAISGLVASRAEIMQKVDQFCDLLESESNLPLWQRPVPGSGTDQGSGENSEQAVAYIQSLINASPQERLRYLPIISFFEPFTASWLRTQSGFREYLHAECDATLVSIALEIHHRRHGTWPDRLAQLVPQLLPAVPLDRYDGQPLRYRQIDGKPLLYSVSFNRIDDGGLKMDGPHLWQDPQAVPTEPGDWVLFQIP